jgi:hypothetical protein
MEGKYEMELSNNYTVNASKWLVKGGEDIVQPYR